MPHFRLDEARVTRLSRGTKGSIKMGAKRSNPTARSQSAYDKWVHGGRAGPAPKLVQKKVSSEKPAAPVKPTGPVPFEVAAAQLGVTVSEVHNLVLARRLRPHATGQGVARHSLKAELRRKREKRRAADAAWAAAQEEAHARRPARGYAQPKDGLSSRPSSAGLPTLGKR